VTDPGRLAEPVSRGASAARGGVLVVALAIATAFVVGARQGSREQRAALALSATAMALAAVSTSRIPVFLWV
jgi:hypothetical protein